MEFKKYMHVEKYGNTEVKDIELGTCYIFPKIDGTNASIWLNEKNEIQAGSRKRHLIGFGGKEDNAGFYEWVTQQQNIKDLLNEHSNLRLYGEWLVPHSIKDYREDAWRHFYVFDVCIDNEPVYKTNSDGEQIQVNEQYRYLTYDEYKPILEKYNLDYITPLTIVKNPTYETFLKLIDNNKFLMKDGKGNGEGIVIKNYEYKNKYGRVCWAKIVTNEFKEKHVKVMGANRKNERVMIEQLFVNQKCTKALGEKVKAKIENETGDWNSKMIPRLLNTIFHDLVTEEIWDFIKKNKNPTINFRTLQTLTNIKVKELLSEIF